MANVGSRSAITRKIYRKHVRSLKNRLAIRIRRPVMHKIYNLKSKRIENYINHKIFIDFF